MSTVRPTAAGAGAVPDEATKARTIAHMNSDHKDDMRLYLEHFNGVAPAAAAGARMEDIDMSSMTLRTPYGTYVVRIEPPMPTWAARRETLVAMSLRARAAAGLCSDDGIVIDEYAYPEKGQQRIVLYLVLFYFFSWILVALGFVEPGTHAWDGINAAGFPYGAKGFRWIVKAIFIPVLAIHFAEVWWINKTRLSKFGVQRGSALWWKWIISNFFEGFGAIERFDKLVKEKRRKMGNGPKTGPW